MNLRAKREDDPVNDRCWKSLLYIALSPDYPFRYGSALTRR